MEFRILGSFEADAGGVMLPLGGPRERTVLAVLLLEASRTVAVTRLVDAVWPDAPPTTAAKQVRNAISLLRAILACHGPSAVIAADGAGYRLEVPACTPAPTSTPARPPRSPAPRLSGPTTCLACWPART